MGNSIAFLEEVCLAMYTHAKHRSHYMTIVFPMNYILRMCASNLRSAGNNEQSVLVLWKAVQLMPHSGIGWSEKDYLKLAAWLYEDGRIADGDKVERYIRNNRNIQFDANIQNVAMRNFQNASRNGLVRYDNHSGICCEIGKLFLKLRD